MAGRLLSVAIKGNGSRFVVPFGSVGCHHSPDYKKAIGNREIVGFGINGLPSYIDRIDFPMPAIRWKETTPDIRALQERAKGDWRKLSIEEKKALYRASFCQTFAEFTAPTGEWKSIMGGSLCLIACGLWLFILLKLFVYPPLPASFSEESRQAQLRRMLDLRVNPVTGISSKWDYEKDDWKK